MGKFTKPTEGYWKKCIPFLSSLSELFDIQATKDYRVIMEKVWNLDMTPKDKLFYEQQKMNPPLGSCESKTDLKWEKHKERKEI